MNGKYRLITHKDGTEQVYSFERANDARQLGTLLETYGTEWKLHGPDGEQIA